MGGPIRHSQPVSPALTAVDYVDFVFGGPSTGAYPTTQNAPNGFAYNLQVGDSVMFANPATAGDSGIWEVTDASGENVTFSRRSDFGLGTKIYANQLVLTKKTVLGYPCFVVLYIEDQDGAAISSGLLDGSTFVYAIFAGGKYVYTFPGAGIEVVDDGNGNVTVVLAQSVFDDISSLEARVRACEVALGIPPPS